MSETELQKYRSEFWETRNQGTKDVWEVLRNSVNADPSDAEAFIKASGLRCHAGVMTLVFDENKFPYRIPIACISEPTKYLPSDVDQLNNAEKPAEEDYENMKIRTVGTQDYEFSCSNYKTVGEIKIEFLDETERSSLDSNNVILLYGGRKLNDKLPLYGIYNLTSDMVIMAMIVGDDPAAPGMPADS